MNDKNTSNKTENEEIYSLDMNQPIEKFKEYGDRMKAFEALVSSTHGNNSSQNYTSSSDRDYSDTKMKRNITRTNAPRNVQNNNLGNIKHNPNNDWKGQTDEKKDGTFVSFKTPEYGVRALARVVKANINATNSIEEYVNRYASEPKEKEYYKRTGKLMPHLQNYAKVIASSQGIRDIKKMPKNIDMKKWIKATAVAEGGGKALKYFTDDIIEHGINMS